MVAHGTVRPGGFSMDLVILIGLQGSGKTTFYRTHFAATHEHVSKDRLRHNKTPSRWQVQLIDDALQAGRSVVVDNTNPTVADRAPLIALGRAHGARISGYYFEPSVITPRARSWRHPPTPKDSTCCMWCASPATGRSRSTSG
jgi:predicted kinase